MWKRGCQRIKIAKGEARVGGRDMEPEKQIQLGQRSSAVICVASEEGASRRAASGTVELARNVRNHQRNVGEAPIVALRPCFVHRDHDRDLSARRSSETTGDDCNLHEARGIILVEKND